MQFCTPACRYGSTLSVNIMAQVDESKEFERDEFDVHSDASVSFTQAVLGGEVKVQGLDGPVMLKVSLTPPVEVHCS